MMNDTEMSDFYLSDKKFPVIKSWEVKWKDPNAFVSVAWAAEKVYVRMLFKLI